MCTHTRSVLLGQYKRDGCAQALAPVTKLVIDVCIKALIVLEVSPLNRAVISALGAQESENMQH